MKFRSFLKTGAIVALFAATVYVSILALDRPKSCCARKGHPAATAAATLSKIVHRPDPNCPHAKKVKEQKEKGNLRFYAAAWADYLANFSFSGPTMPPGPWDEFENCWCPSECLW